MKSRHTLSAALLAAMLATAATAATYTWTGATDTNIDTTSNWSPTLATLTNADTVQFDGNGTSGTLTIGSVTGGTGLNGSNPGFLALSVTSGQTSAININSTVGTPAAASVIRMASLFGTNDTFLAGTTNGISLASGSGALSFNAANAGGLVLNVGGGGSGSSRGSVAINNNNASGGSKITFGANTILSGGGSGNTSTTADRQINFGGTGDIDIQGRIMDSAATNSGRKISITKSGTGTLTLSGDNANTTDSNSRRAYSGGTTISDGVLVAAHQNALGTGFVTVNGGTLRSSVATVSGFGTLTMATGTTLDLNTASAGTFGLAANSNFVMSGGTFEYTVGDQITSSGTGTFTITGGTLDLNSTISDYSITYTFLSGFSSGSVTGLTITGYDNTNWLADFSNAGVLSFTAAAVPEPASFAALAGLVGLGFAASRRRRQSA